MRQWTDGRKMGWEEDGGKMGGRWEEDGRKMGDRWKMDRSEKTSRH